MTPEVITMFQAASSVLNDVATISSGITGTALDVVLAVDDTVLLYRDQVSIWRRAKEIELESMGLKPTESNSKFNVNITSPQG